MSSVASTPKPYTNGFSTLNGEANTEEPNIDWKTVITNTIDADKENLFCFLDTFDSAVRNGNIDNLATVTTTPAAKAVSDYLSERGIKSKTISPPLQEPSLASIFDAGEGPCMVLNGLLSLVPPLLSDLSVREIPACTAGTAAVVAAYTYLHSLRNHLTGTVVLATISDEGAAARYLLHIDERRPLWRGDCMLSCSSTIGGLTASTVTHPLATALSNNGFRVTGKRPSIGGPVPQGVCKLWSEAGVPSYSYGVRGGDTLSREGFLELVKVIALSAWDFLRMDD